MEISIFSFTRKGAELGYQVKEYFDRHTCLLYSTKPYLKTKIVKEGLYTWV